MGSQTGCGLHTIRTVDRATLLECMAGTTRLEPAASAVTGRRLTD
jgi:hypothetical protein